MNYKIVNDEVLVEVLNESPQRGLIYLPPQARQTLQLGRVLQNNTSLPLKEGDLVGFQNYTGRPFPSRERTQSLWLLKPEHVEVKVEP